MTKCLQEIRSDLRKVVEALDDMADAEFDRTGISNPEIDDLIGDMQKKYNL